MKMWCSTTKKILDSVVDRAKGFRSQQRQERLYMRLGACLIVLAVASYYMMNQSVHSEQNDSPTKLSLAQPAAIASIALNATSMPENKGNDAPAAPSGESAPPDSGKLVTVQDSTPTLALSSQSDVGGQFQYKISPNAQVILNGVPAKLADLKSGDDVKIKAANGGLATIVEVVRSKSGIVLNTKGDAINVTTDYLDKVPYHLMENATIKVNGKPAVLQDLCAGDGVTLVPNESGRVATVDVTRKSLFDQFWDNFRKNLFKPLLLFFYMGFLIPVLKIAFEFPRAVYQGLTIYLLIAIGWHGGEELSILTGAVLNQALGFIIVGFIVNGVLGLLAFFFLRTFVPKMRRIDSATVAAYYGSDSAGTFVTCIGVLQAAHIAFAAYMPVMLAVMEIPGCLVGLYLVSRLRASGMDKDGNMPGEPRYDRRNRALAARAAQREEAEGEHHGAATAPAAAAAPAPETKPARAHKNPSSMELVREVLLNPGLFLLFGGIIIGYLSRLQGVKVVELDDKLFVTLFQGLLCLFLLEMGMTASRHLKDLTTASWRFVVFGLAAPNVFATIGICVATIFSHAIHMPFQLGTYVLFAVLCGSASYIAVPAIQRIAIPEASPTLPLAASLGLTFSYNVTIGIPVYLVIAQNMITMFPVV